MGFEERYTWRHNGVLCVLMNHIAAHIKENNNRGPSCPRKKIQFVKAGFKSRKVYKPTVPYSILCQSNDWKLCFDIPEHTGSLQGFTMPHEIVISPLKVDLLIISAKIKTVIFCELTAPMRKISSNGKELKRTNTVICSVALILVGKVFSTL